MLCCVWLAKRSFTRDSFFLLLSLPELKRTVLARPISEPGLGELCRGDAGRGARGYTKGHPSHRRGSAAQARCGCTTYLNEASHFLQDSLLCLATSGCLCILLSRPPPLPPMYQTPARVLFEGRLAPTLAN